MRLILALGVALAATTMMAHAQTEERSTERTRVFVHHAGGHESADANDDGWVSREESSAGAERMFARLDRNDDGRLTDADRPRLEEFNIHVGGPGHASEADDDNCERTESGEGGNRRVTIICRSERGEGGEVRRHVLRRGEGDVIIRRHGDGEGVMIAPVPPVPPVPPMMWLMDEDSEADINNDGAISLEEFRTQHLRMFDARDANGDGRVRAHRMPDPPTPPVPPTPPSPPRRG